MRGPGGSDVDRTGLQDDWERTNNGYGLQCKRQGSRISRYFGATVVW